MKKNETKRYLITYADDAVDTSAASDLLGIASGKIKEGVDFLETEAIPQKDDVLHFENLGITSTELTPDEVDNVSHKEGILAVEEDVEMYALETVVEEPLPLVDEQGQLDEKQYNELFGDDYGEAQEPEDAGITDGTYLKGYDRAILDVFSSLLRSTQNGNGGSHAPSFVPYQPIPRKIAPRFPVGQPVPWNISLVKAPQAWARGLRGEGVRVAVIDTGIASHPDLSIAGGVSFVPGVVSYNDDNGHGTHCAGIIGARSNAIGVIGVAPRCSLYGVKVLKHDPITGRASGYSSWIIAGMEWCIRHKMNVASMSLGGAMSPMIAYATAVRRCQNNRVTVVTASGNSYGTPFPWVNAPANSITRGMPNASPIAVGAIDRNCVAAGFSSRGGQNTNWNQVTVVGPGVSINSTVLRGEYAVHSGTSMACPHVAGLAALLCQRYPGITPANSKRRIGSTSTDLGPIGYDIAYGFGLINCDFATR